MDDKTLVETDWQKAVAETNRLQRELDITNADRIALWIEANTIPDEPMNQCASWLACRIVEAHEKAQATRIEALEADNAELREVSQRVVDAYWGMVQTELAASAVGVELARQIATEG